MNELMLFIKNYSDKDLSRICVTSTRKDNTQWQDENVDFRHQVCERVISAEFIVPDLLLKDLFRQEAIFCREAWGATKYIGALGALLLEKTQERYIEDYFIGRGESFDTECSVSLFDVSAELWQIILKNIKSKKLQTIQGQFEMTEVVDFISEHVESLN